MDPANALEALREVRRSICRKAPTMSCQPGLPYLDITGG